MCGNFSVFQNIVGRAQTFGLSVWKLVEKGMKSHHLKKKDNSFHIHHLSFLRVHWAVLFFSEHGQPRKLRVWTRENRTEIRVLQDCAHLRFCKFETSITRTYPFENDQITPVQLALVEGGTNRAKFQIWWNGRLRNAIVVSRNVNKQKKKKKKKN